ncbi:FUSC family protein [Mycolicibacterium mengxianglii]|uniref:FUSC family protein n=1 Tax=Mycolicibacterium mengxianglii TaxID=2736649 RepID=UPI0018D151C8|nr:FUSC family protein [Mycolicibacterium mengxianglii]
MSRFHPAELLRPVGRSRWGMAVVLGVALAAVLALPGFGGHPQLASAIGLGFVLTAVPTLPLSLRAAAITITTRGAGVIGGAIVAVLTSGHPVALGLATVVAAVIGALRPTLGPTAALAVVLIAVDTGNTAQWSQMPAYVVGAAVVPVAWLCWRATVMLAGKGSAASSRAPQDVGADGSPRLEPHALRVGAAVALAVTISACLPADLVGAHWLVTCVVLTIQPAAVQTGVRLVQRLSGNAVGALVAAGLLGADLPGLVVIWAAVVLFVVAMALRPVNYTWWAVTGPPVLLIISEYPGRFPWYEGGVRLAMNLLGAAVVVLVVFAVPALMGRVAPTSGRNIG